MERAKLTVAHEIAEIARTLQHQRTGHAPSAVTVVLCDDTLVVSLREALTPAEIALARSPQGAAKVQEFHRQLFANSTDEMRQVIKRITGRAVREAAAEVETSSGTVVHTFTTGAMVLVFLLTPSVPTTGRDGQSSLLPERANGDGRMAADADVSG